MHVERKAAEQWQQERSSSQRGHWRPVWRSEIRDARALVRTVPEAMMLSPRPGTDALRRAGIREARVELAHAVATRRNCPMRHCELIRAWPLFPFHFF